MAALVVADVLAPDGDRLRAPNFWIIVLCESLAVSWW